MILAIRSLHVLSAVAMLGGIFVRQIVRLEALRTLDVRRFATLSDAVRRLGALLVIPGSAAVGLLGLLLALMTGAPRLGFLQGSDRNWLLVAILLMLSGSALVPLVLCPNAGGLRPR